MAPHRASGTRRPSTEQLVFEYSEKELSLRATVGITGALSAVCRALFEGDASGWDVAAQILPTLDRNEGDSCLMRTAFDTLEALVHQHTQHPDVLITVGQSSGTGCPLELQAVSYTDVAMGTKQLMTNPSVSVQGGVRLRLRGRFLEPVVVILGQSRFPTIFVGENHFDFVVPPAPGPAVMPLRVESAGVVLPGELTFTYTADPPASGATTTSPPPSPSPPAPTASVP